MLQFLFDFFSGKVKTRVFTTFLGWLLILHIDILYIAVLTDQAILFEKTQLLKGEYLISYITHFGLWLSIGIEILRLAVAVLMTYLMIWVVPKIISEKSYKAELEVEYSLRKMKVAKEEELNRREEVAVKRQLENIETEKQIVAERTKLEQKPEEAAWDAEYRAFKKTEAFDYLERIIRVVYDYGGDPRRAPHSTPTRILAYLDTNGIINLVQGSIGFTEKGRHFVKIYSANNRR